MSFRLIVATLLSAFFVSISVSLGADSYRCGRKLIHSGDSSAEVLRICGEPRYRDRGHESVRLGGARKKLPVERWYYKKSKRSLEHIVMIYRGRVIEITTGSR